MIYVILLILLIIIAFLWAEKGKYLGGGAPRAEYKKSPESKFESLIRGYLEALLGHKFPLVHPSWLNGLELDGYNEDLKLAFEAQGPLHYKYVPRLDSTYEKYLARVKNDEKKAQITKKKGIWLMTVDYMVPKYLIGDYLKSRIHDGVKAGILTDEGLVARFSARPFKYVEPSGLVPVLRPENDPK